MVLEQQHKMELLEDAAAQACSGASDALASKHQMHPSVTRSTRVHNMRTTLDIDTSVLAAVKELAQREGKTAGAILSELARQALTQTTLPAGSALQEAAAIYGFRPLPIGNELVTNELVDRLRDEQGV